ncbi:uncharacterized protein DUF4383 [Diaminobutyricimonas aerilata]|uniref:Uncharacterized protein DUF4383 n=1 Tax=Diaminobutyricimonas aerilata TaxID=1162967 RepID=A0A2M9CP28_9MICO|nr:DUF4383 domain-containing protein [Diaminobutyricimonas aerilata]PJJ73666.1 uncharacterized protein DUF4383 [Diaminobutyricimonas aerilata]
MTKSPNRLLGVVFGAVYILVGILGFFVDAPGGFFAQGGEGGLLLGIFEVNPFHNVAHLLIGAALLIAGLSNVRAAKATNTVVGAAYLLLGLIGLFIIDSPANILAINAADNVLHFLSAALLLAVGLGVERDVRTTRTV